MRFIACPTGTSQDCDGTGDFSIGDAVIYATQEVMEQFDLSEGQPIAVELVQDQKHLWLGIPTPREANSLTILLFDSYEGEVSFSGTTAKIVRVWPIIQEDGSKGTAFLASIMVGKQLVCRSKTSLIINKNVAGELVKSQEECECLEEEQTSFLGKVIQLLRPRPALE